MLRLERGADMTLGQTHNTLERRLRKLWGQVRQIRLAALGAGASPGADPLDPSAAARLRRLGEELAEVQEGLALVARELGTIGHLLDMRERMALKLAREDRWRTRDSIRTHERRQRELHQLMHDILADIDDLVRAAGGSTARERLEMLTEAVQKVQEFRQHVTPARVIVDGPAVMPAQHVAVNVPLEGVVLAAYVLVAWLRRRLGRGG
jgi:hypothetical protein